MAWVLATDSMRVALDKVLVTRTRAAAVALTALVVLPATALYSFRLIRWWRHIRQLHKMAAYFPHRPYHWLLGHLLDDPGPVGDVAVNHIIDHVKQFPRVYAYYFGPFNSSLVCCHPETVKAILRTSEPKTTNDFGPYQFIRQWLGDGLLVSTGQTWHRNRKLLTPAFHFDVLKPYIQIYNMAADKMISKWENAVKTDPSVEIYQPVSLCTLEVIMRCAFSYEEDVQSLGETHPYTKATTSLSTLICHRLFNIHLYPDLLFNLSPSGRSFHDNVSYVRKTAYEIINKRKSMLAADPSERRKRYLDFLDILLLARDEDGKGLNDKEVRQEVDTFLFEGHDTVASGISWCLYTLAQHPEEQARARKEVDDLLSGRASQDIQWDDMSQLPYLTMCIKESLRIHPPVAIVERELTEPLELEGRLIPKNATIVISVIGIHHNETVWGSDHWEFKPERFESENINKMDSHAFIPFSAGPRNCIGQHFAMHELKTIIAKTLHRLELAVDTRHPTEHTLEIILRSKDGIRLLLTPRTP